MSAHVFCPSCGTKNEPLNGRKPNFCVSCGHNFQSLAVFGGSTPSPARQARPSSGAVDIELGGDDDSGSYEEAGISKADLEIVVDSRQKVTVAGILGTREPGIVDENARQSIDHKLGKRVNTKKAFENFATEAGKGGVKRVEVG